MKTNKDEGRVSKKPGFFKTNKNSTKNPKKIPIATKRRKLITITVAFLVVLAAVLVAVYLFLGQASASNLIEKTGKQYYTEQFYKQVESLGDKKSEFLEKSHDTGIFVSLENLKRFAKHNKDGKELSVLEKATEKCDVNTTKVKITPNEPFGVEDFTVEAILEGCK